MVAPLSEARNQKRSTAFRDNPLVEGLGPATRVKVRLGYIAVSANQGQAQK